MGRRLFGAVLVIASSIVVLWNSRTAATVVMPMSTNCPATPRDAPQTGFYDDAVSAVSHSSAINSAKTVTGTIRPARVILSNVTVTFQISSGLPITCLKVTWKTVDKKLKSTSTFQSDSDGKVVFPVLPSGEVEFTYSATWLGEPGVILDGGTKVVSVPPVGRTLLVEIGEEPPTTVVRRIKVVMPDGSPVPDAKVWWISTDIVGCGSGYRLDGFEDWRIGCLGPSSFKLTDSSGATWMKGFDGELLTFPYYDGMTPEEAMKERVRNTWQNEFVGGRNWVNYRSLCARVQGCPSNIAIAKFEDNFLSQTEWVEFDTITNSAGLGAYGNQIVIQLEQMPVVKLVSDDSVDAGVGDPIDVVVSTVDGSGESISGQFVTLAKIGSAGIQSAGTGTVRAGASGCSPRLSGVSNAQGRVTLRICASSTSTWRVDGKGIVGSKSLSVNVRPRTVRIGRKIAISSVLGSVIPRGAKVSVVIDKKSASVCSGGSTTLRGIRVGTCAAVVTVKPSGRSATKTKVVVEVVR